MQINITYGSVMVDDVWKQYEQNPITHSVAHYLMAIADLREAHGYARVTDVAKRLNVTRGAASLTLKGLRAKGLVCEDDNRFLLLGQRGTAFVGALRARNAVLRAFLTDVLGLPADVAEVDTCKIEHLIGRETALRLGAFVRFLQSDCPAARSFQHAWTEYGEPCGGEPTRCPPCKEACMRRVLGGRDGLAAHRAADGKAER